MKNRLLLLLAYCISPLTLTAQETGEKADIISFFLDCHDCDFTFGSIFNNVVNERF